jgi:putative ABC transport system permease protein
MVAMPSVLSQAVRSWKTARAVAILAAVALGLGIGSATAIYTVVNSVMLRPLPYPHADRLVALYRATISQPRLRGAHTYPDLQEYQKRTRRFDLFGWFESEAFNLTSPGAPQHIGGVAVTPPLVQNLGLNPVIGRWFSSETEAVISNGLWQRLGGKPGILGQSIILDGRVYSISGVMGPHFRFPLPGPGTDAMHPEVWIPLDPSGKGQPKDLAMLFCYARMKPGVTISQAEQDVRSVASQIAAQDASGHASYSARLDRLRDAALIDIRATLLLLFAASGLLLLITCANVSGLLLARSVARARETAIRVALGAARRQLAVLYFLEGLLVSLAGAAIGVALSIGLVRLVISIAADFIPLADEISVDWTVFLFALAAAAAASALSSLAPLWQASHTEAHEVLTDGVRSSAGARSRRLSQSLVVGEIALAFTLLAVSGILISHWIQLSRVHPGFDPDRLLTFQLNIPTAKASTDARRVAYEKSILDALHSIPGVTGAASVNQLPLSCCFSTTIYADGRPADTGASQRTSMLNVSPEYWQTMRIPLRAGRLLTEHDDSQTLPDVVINQAAANRYWPNQNPVGQYGRFLVPNGDRFQIAGVVGDVQNEGLDKPTVPEIYISSTIQGWNPTDFVVRASQSPEALAGEVRRVIQRVDPEQAVYNVASMNELVHDSLSLQRVGSFMVTFFAVAALVMATLGIYGVVAYSVRQRTIEIGTRMALGAIGRDVLSLVLGGGMRMAALGVALGGAATVAAAWLLIRSFEIHDAGVLPFVSSTAIVAAIAMAASFFPAWRATLLSPMVAIRNQPDSMWESTRQSFFQAFRGISDAVWFRGDVAAAPGGKLLTEFAQAVRTASSFPEAFQAALDTLCATIGAQSAFLLEEVEGHEFRITVASPRREDLNDALPARGFLWSRLQSLGLPLPLSAGDLDAWVRWAMESKPDFVAEAKALQASGARLAVPLRARSEITGILLLGPPVERAEFTATEKQLLANCADQLALMIENARLTGRVVEQEKLRRDLDLASEVQRRLLPDHPPEAGPAQIAALSVPARSVGGDYYDFLELGDRRIGIALADIAGKGIAAALIMSVVQASLRVIAGEGDVSLPQLAARLNRLLHRSTKSSSYATFFYAQLDETNLKLRYVNAGHNPPYLIRRVQVPITGNEVEIQELDAGGTVLGLFPQVKYEDATVDLQPGDVLLVFTDGVSEALNTRDEEFGEDRLKELLRGVLHLSAQEISEAISARLKHWMQGAAQHDDLTFIVLKVAG